MTEQLQLEAESKMRKDKADIKGNKKIECIKLKRKRGT